MPKAAATRDDIAASDVDSPDSPDVQPAHTLMEVVDYETLEPFTTKDGSTIREYLHSPAQSLAEATLEPGQATTRHYHAVSEEIYLLVGGGGTMELDGETRAVGEGDAILIPPGAWHELRAGPDGVRLLCVAACRRTVTPTRISADERVQATRVRAACVVLREWIQRDPYPQREGSQGTVGSRLQDPRVARQ